MPEVLAHCAVLYTLLLSPRLFIDDRVGPNPPEHNRIASIVERKSATLRDVAFVYLQFSRTANVVRLQ